MRRFIPGETGFSCRRDGPADPSEEEGRPARPNHRVPSPVHHDEPHGRSRGGAGIPQLLASGITRLEPGHPRAASAPASGDGAGTREHEGMTPPPPQPSHPRASPDVDELKRELELAEAHVRALRRALSATKRGREIARGGGEWFNPWPALQRRTPRIVIAIVVACILAAAALTLVRNAAPPVPVEFRPWYTALTGGLYVASLALIIVGVANPRPIESLAAAVLSLEAMVLDTGILLSLPTSSAGSLAIVIGIPVVNAVGGWVLLRYEATRSRAAVWVIPLPRPR